LIRDVSIKKWNKECQYILAMKDTIRMNASGRLVLPRILRERLSLRGVATLRVEVVAGHIVLVPLAADDAGVVRKGRIAVLKRTGVSVDAAAAVAAERAAHKRRGLRR
jgi:bifunctional DNA-binding transcriptional regulator/antitoxin component of YhaV-PrlF toxin-antitoxin module